MTTDELTFTCDQTGEKISLLKDQSIQIRDKLCNLITTFYFDDFYTWKEPTKKTDEEWKELIMQSLAHDWRESEPAKVIVDMVNAKIAEALKGEK